MSRKILYYPSIDIPCSTWLKNALLYWDEVSSIVPYREYPLPENVSALNNLNCYTPIYPEDIIVENAGRFLDILERRLWEVRDTKTVLSFLHRNKVIMHESKFFDLHKNRLFEQFPEISRMFRSETLVGQWYNVEKNAAMAYMKTLAEFAVMDNEDMVIGTNEISEADCWKNGYGIPTDDNSLFEIVFNKCIPMPNDNMSVEQVVEFKREYGNQLVNFQTEIEVLRNELARCKSLGDLQEVFNNFQSKIDAANNVAEKTFKEKSIRYLKGSLKTGVRSLISLDILLEWATNISTFTDFLELGIDHKSMAVGALAEAGLHIAKVVFADGVERRKVLNSNYAYIMHAHQYGMYRKR